jgi:histidine decarboxylase
MNKKEVKRLDRLYDELKVLKKTFLGYPCDAEFNYAPLYRFLEFPINNVGDPFEASTYRLQTKQFEREVLQFFAKLFHLRNYWGYVTNGGTEGNLYGLYVARETHPDATVLFSEHTHYSIKKNVHILGMKHELVKSQANGEMDYDDFERRVRWKKHAIVVANIGSTMTGAVDDVQRIARILEKHKVKYYLHADAALYGMVLPFCSSMKFDFRTKINSIAVSGHKFVGSPIPCGIVLARKSAVKNLQSYIEYIDAHDTTLSGSRDAFTPLIFWYRIKTIGLRGFKKQVEYSNSLAEYLVSELKRIGWPDVDKSYVTVRFKRPSERLVKKWELAVHEKMAHVICLPHETKEQLHRFVQELAEELPSR